MKTQDTRHCPFERIAPNEQEHIEEITTLTTELQKKRYPSGTPALRGVHPKSHGCVRAKFTVNSELPGDLRVGVFLQPDREFDAWVRFSNADNLVRADVINGERGSRGMAIKVLNVGDEAIEPDQGSVNQDFLMINQPMFAFPNTQEYLTLMRVLDQHEDKPDAFFAPLSNVSEKAKTNPSLLTESERHLLTTFGIAKSIKSTPAELDNHPMSMQYFSAAPFLFGENRLMKYSAVPINPPAAGQPDATPPADFLRDAITQTMSGSTSVEFDFRIQVAKYDDSLQVENASVTWDESDHPFISVAQLSITSPQDIGGAADNADQCESMRFTPWHCLPDHQPVGSINRLRRSVYEASADFRL